MKRKKTASSQQQRQLSSPKSTVLDKDDFYLPDECWEHVFEFLIMDEDNNSSHDHQFHRYSELKSLSVVSKQFLTITNRLRLSISINVGLDRELAFPARIFQRFSNLTSLELNRRYYYHSYIDKFLCRLSGFSLNPKTLNLSYEPTIPANELQAFPQIISTLTSLTCFLVNFDYNNTIMFLIAHCFPNLQLLYLNYCIDVPQKGIAHILNKCCNIRHLNLAHCFGMKLHGMNFEAPKLEVLNLTFTIVDDETLYWISKSFRGLLELCLHYCSNVTQKGVKHVVENCTQLREIDLGNCNKVHGDIVESMVSSRPSLRKITAPPSFRFNERNKELFLQHGCLVI